MDPLSFLAYLFISAGIGLAAKSGKRKTELVTVKGKLPFFMADFGHGLTKPEWAALASGKHVIGAIMKATQGFGPPHDPDPFPTKWFVREWEKCRIAGGARYGHTWFRGAYHFLIPGNGTEKSGALQADFIFDTIEQAGGFRDGDLPVAMDIEGDAWNDNKSLRRKVSMGFARRAIERDPHGREPILYANGDIGIGPNDGFRLMWTPHPKRLAKWPIDRFAIYQYAGLNKGKVSYYNRGDSPARRKFPLRIPGFGSNHGTDMNVILDERGNAITDASELRARLLGE